MKKCIHCLHDKDYIYFDKGRNSCKSCRNEQDRARKLKKRLLRNVLNGRASTKKVFDDCLVCKTCAILKSMEFFNKAKRKDGTIYYYPNCKECSKFQRAIICKKYYNGNKEYFLEKSRDYCHKNVEREAERHRSYKLNNGESIKKNRALRAKASRIENPNFKLKANISRRIRSNLKKNNASKYSESCSKYLGYSFPELKSHLESQFESWMNWDNWGVYSPKTWNDNDPSTWKWQLDHIIPHSTFKYDSMGHPDFLKCWSLDNLRPYSAKQNFIDGITRVRHKVEK